MEKILNSKLRIVLQIIYFRLWKKMPKHDGFIASISLDSAAASANVEFIRWKVHLDWVQQVRSLHSNVQMSQQNIQLSGRIQQLSITKEQGHFSDDLVHWHLGFQRLNILTEFSLTLLSFHTSNDTQICTYCSMFHVSYFMFITFKQGHSFKEIP